MAIRLSGARLQYGGTVAISTVKFYLFAFRLKMVSLASATTLYDMYSPAGGGGAVPLITIRINANGSVYYLVETAPIAVDPWEALTDPGFITGSEGWFTLVCYLDGATGLHIFKDNVEATYASTTAGGASPFALDGSVSQYLGGTLAGAQSSFDFDQFAIWDGAPNAQMAQSAARQLFADDWSLRFFTDYLEGSSNRPGQMFMLNAFGDLTANPNLLPVDEWSAAGPVAVTGTPSYVESPMIIEPAGADEPGAGDFSPPPDEEEEEPPPEEPPEEPPGVPTFVYRPRLRLRPRAQRVC